mgnify:CR=1 FL=1
MKHLKRINLFIVVIFLLNTSSYGQDKYNPWLISFGVNAVDFYPVNIRGITDSDGNDTQWYDEFFNFNDHYNYIEAPSKLSLGRYLSKSFSLELAISVNKITKIGNINVEESDILGNDDLEGSLSYIAIDANTIYNINNLIGDTKWFEPYALGGLGFNSKNSKTRISLNVGGGAKFWITKKFGTKIQTAYKHFFDEGNYPHFQHSASLMYKFGSYDEDNDGVYDKNDKCPTVFGLVEFGGCPDSDNDGITDSEDKCPNVFGVESLNGCPDADLDGVTDKEDKCPYYKGLPKNNGCPDSDNDGLIDQIDLCPRVAGPLSNKGCPEPDTDGDGIVDKYDKCKFEKGVVSNDGCPEFIKEELEVKLTQLARSILFVSGSNVFYRKYESQLDEIANLMKLHEDLKFQIQGHTDNRGSEQTNLKLSLYRVNKVLNYLVSKGVDQFNLKVKGFGETMPIASNDTQEGRAKNRRVEVKIIN